MPKKVKKSTRPKNYSRMRYFGPISLVACAVIFLLAGCGSSEKTVIVNPSGALSSMPTPSAATTANTYMGTDSLGWWSISLNDTADSYSYIDSTYSATATTGTFTTSNGFINLGQSSSGSSLGFALEVQSRMLLLRPGDNTAGLIVAVPQTTCYDIPYRLLFNYIPMEAAPGGGTFSTSNYASVVLNTDSTGANWQYQDLTGYPVSGPASFTGSCAMANGEATMGVSETSLFNLYNNGYGIGLTYGVEASAPTTSLAIGPSGVFVANQIYQVDTMGYVIEYPTGSVGVVEPTSALTTTTVAAGKYLGFLTEPATDGYYQSGVTTYAVPGVTSPVSFGQTASSGTTMTGGAFPDDDVTETPNADISITLGAQSSTTNGLYPNAAVTMLDPNQNCATALAEGNSASLTVGTNVDGYVTCTYPAVAVVGNPDGKYVIFLDTRDPTAGSYSTVIGKPMQMYLFQQ